MAIDWFTSLMTSHYDTPGNFDKNLRFVTVDSVPSNLKVKLVLQIAQHMPNK